MNQGFNQTTSTFRGFLQTQLTPYQKKISDQTIQRIQTGLDGHLYIYQQIDDKITLLRLDLLLLLYYTKSQIDIILLDYFTKLEINVILLQYFTRQEIIDGFYSKDEINNILLNYFTKLEILEGFYQKYEIDTKFLEYYTSDQIDQEFTFYYSKDQINLILEDYFTKLEIVDNFYEKTEIDNKFLEYYTSDQIDTEFTFYFTKNEINNKFTFYYNQEQIDNKFLLYLTENQVNLLLTNYYTITESQNNFYFKTFIDNKFLEYYTSSQIDNEFTFYYTKIDVFNKDEINEKFGILEQNIEQDYYRKLYIDDELYTKLEIDTLLNGKQRFISTSVDNIYWMYYQRNNVNYLINMNYNNFFYNKIFQYNTTQYFLSQTNNVLSLFNPLSLFYTKSEIDTNIYTKSEIDTNIYTKTQINNLLNDKITKQLTSINSKNYLYIQFNNTISIINITDQSTNTLFYIKSTIDTFLTNQQNDYNYKIDLVQNDLTSNYTTTTDLEQNFLKIQQTPLNGLKYVYFQQNNVFYKFIGDQTNDLYYTKNEIYSLDQTIISDQLVITNGISTNLSTNYYDKNSIDGFNSTINSNISGLQTQINLKLTQPINNTGQNKVIQIGTDQSVSLVSNGSQNLIYYSENQSTKQSQIEITGQQKYFINQTVSQFQNETMQSFYIKTNVKLSINDLETIHQQQDSHTFRLNCNTTPSFDNLVLKQNENVYNNPVSHRFLINNNNKIQISTDRIIFGNTTFRGVTDPNCYLYVNCYNQQQSYNQQFSTPNTIVYLYGISTQTSDYQTTNQTLRQITNSFSTGSYVNQTFSTYKMNVNDYCKISGIFNSNLSCGNLIVGQSSKFIKNEIQYNFDDNYDQFFQYQLIKYKYKSNFNDCTIGQKDQNNKEIKEYVGQFVEDLNINYSFILQETTYNLDIIKENIIQEEIEEEKDEYDLKYFCQLFDLNIEDMDKYKLQFVVKDIETGNHIKVIEINNKTIKFDQKFILNQKDQIILKSFNFNLEKSIQFLLCQTKLLYDENKKQKEKIDNQQNILLQQNENISKMEIQIDLLKKQMNLVLQKLIIE